MGELHIAGNDDLVDALRARKDELGLSNAFIEDRLKMCGGACDKYIGPSQTKFMSVYLMFRMLAMMGLRLTVEDDPNADVKLLERREDGKVHPPRRPLGRKVMERAKPLVARQMGVDGARARLAMQSAQQRSEIAQTAAFARWEKWRREQQAKSR